MKKVLNKWKYTIIFGFLVVLVALGLRLYNLNLLPIFGDEAIYVRWAQVMRSEPTLRFLPLSDGKQPLFMWAIIPFFKFFSDPLFAGRTVSILTGMGTLVGIFTLTYLLFKSASSRKVTDTQAKKIALIASLIYAVSPFSVFFDRMALVDSMLSFFGIWTLLFGVLTAKTLRLDFAMISGFILGLALLTKSPATFFAILLPTTWILAKWQSNSKRKTLQLIKLLFLLLVSYSIAYGMYNILRLGPNFHMLAIRNEDYIFPLTHIFQTPLDPFLPYIDRSLEWFWILGPSTIVLLGLSGILLNVRKIPREILILCIWFFVPILIQSEFAKVFTARYLLFTLPSLVILAASSFLGKPFRQIMIVLLIIFIFHALWIDNLLLTNIEAAALPRSERSGYLEEWTSGTGIREVAKIITDEAKNLPVGRRVVVGTEGYFGTLPDGLQIYVNDIPQITVIGVGLGIKEIPKPLVESKNAGNKTYLVVNSTRFEGKLDQPSLKLIAAYPKAVRPDGDRETLLFFEVNNISLKDK